MSLGSYIGEVHRIAEELCDDISQEEVETIYQELMSLSYHGWREWKKKNQDIISKYVGSTPTQRAKLKQFKTLMPLLAFASYQDCLAAYDLLRLIESHFLFPGNSYRGMASSAADVYYEIREFSHDQSWPWPWCDNPLIDDSENQ